MSLSNQQRRELADKVYDEVWGKSLWKSGMTYNEAVITALDSLGLLKDGQEGEKPCTKCEWYYKEESGNYCASCRWAYHDRFVDGKDSK